MAGLVLACACLCAPAAVAQFTLGDIDFDQANWTQYGPFSSRSDVLAEGEYSAERVPEGGNEDAWMETTMRIPAVDSGSIVYWVAQIQETLTWDPAVDRNGPIGSLDFEVDARKGEGPGNRIFTLAVRQDDFVWAAVDKRIFFDGEGWTGTSIPCLDAQDFEPLPLANEPGQPAHPDFSSGGSMLAFGLAEGQSCPSTSDCSQPTARSLGVDNFIVRVFGTQDGFAINPHVADVWFEEATAGQGFYFAVFPELDLLSAAWFTYDVERPDPETPFVIGEPGHRWLTALGSYCGDTAELDIYRTAGGVFDAAEPPADDGVIVGSATIQWTDCNNAVFSYVLPSNRLSGEIPLTRVVPRSEGWCANYRFPDESVQSDGAGSSPAQQ